MALSPQQVESFVYQFRTQIQSLISQQINQNAKLNELQGALNDFIANDAIDDAKVASQSGLVTSGGTGRTNLTAHAVLLGEGINQIGLATIGTSGRVLTDNGAGVDPSFTAPANQRYTVRTDKTATNVVGTVYHNTTGKDIDVVITIADNTAGIQLSVLCDTANPPTVQLLAMQQVSATTNICVTFKVLNNEYYKVVVNFGVGTVNGWFEWS